ncbi:Retaining alpha-galactosidase [Pedobacter sp. HMF7647]|uniref:Retaining alpha-galactosidase n=1 Tax=Hufsiella arboris TaxID=2695275 RepID=A0A7K1Y7N2_9SPHI|nr:glycoside hydrolase family 97 protein [Hufsiella arboris]MXV50583.1 Retaining alpha-galactosidase [Hufsiella arboris]
MRRIFITIAFISSIALNSFSQSQKPLQLSSPDKKIRVSISASDTLKWSVKIGSQQIISFSPVMLTLQNGETWGRNPKVVRSSLSSVNNNLQTPFYKKSVVKDQYSQLVIDFKSDYGLQIRVYNDGAAYRFFSKRQSEIIVKSEQAEFRFDKDYKVFIPYVRDLRVPGDQFISSYEALYDHQNLSQVFTDSLAFLPLLVEQENGIKVGILDADLENYPGMMITKAAGNSLKGTFAGYPLSETPGGHNKFNSVVTKRADYIAKMKGSDNFPWRALVIATNDAQLANNDLVQKLAAPVRVKDVSWIKPGKVAWDWWNDWNISHVDFKAGVNTQTYKHYVDFASANKLEYIILDEGWSDPVDLMKLNQEVSVPELVEYGKQKNVGVILWASWRAMIENADAIMKTYSQLGVKGFKIDFFDRDDQLSTSSTYLIAKKAAENKLLIDLHGIYKPDGLQHTYPNVVNFEGVKGLENSKWTPHDDVPRYDATIPFIRMLAGPMDYTPGAMRNATKPNFYPSNSMPMSQGTRCHQIAMYVVFEAPLQMLADNPTSYVKEQESTTFISKIPTVFDETIALDGKVSEFVSIARRKGDTWYIGALGNWDQRDIELDLSFLGSGNYKAEVFSDGLNADKDATDYKRTVVNVSGGDKIKLHLANGGGWAAIITK